MSFLRAQHHTRRDLNMPLFGGQMVQCTLCRKKGKPEEFVYDYQSKNFYCCQEHMTKFKELVLLRERAAGKGLVLCESCLREIKPDSYACKYCGTIRVPMSGYTIGKMCPFTISQIGSTQYGQGEYVWQLQHCVQEYCALWDLNADCCSLRLRKI